MVENKETKSDNLDPAWQRASFFSSLHGESQTVEKAGFWRRYLAFTVDGFILGILGWFFSDRTWSLTESVPASLLAFLLSLLIPAAYFIWPYSRGGQTVGKRILGLRVVSIDGTPLTLGKGISRTLGYIPSTLALYVGFLWAIFDKDKQAWQDKLAGTIVVRSSYSAEDIRGYLEPAEARRRRRRWLIGLGVPTAIAVSVWAVGYGVFIGRGISQVAAMGDWPSTETSPFDAVDVDLTSLGLKKAQSVNAREEPTWEGGQYEQGALVIFEGSGERAVYIWALRYDDDDSANSDFETVTAWAGQNCGFYTWHHLLGKGLIDCTWTDAHDKILLNRKWMLDVTAVSGSRSKELAVSVLESISAHWSAQH